LWQTNRITVVKFDDILHAVRSILGLMEPLISTLKLAAQMVCIRQSCLFPELFCWGRQFSTRKQKCLELPWMEYINFKQLSQAGLFTSLLWVTTFVMGLHDLNILSLTCVVMQKQIHHITRQCHSEAPHFLLRFIPRFLF